MDKYNQALRDLQTSEVKFVEEAQPTISDQYFYQIKSFATQYPGQLCLSPEYFARFAQSCFAQGAALERIQEVTFFCENVIFKNQHNLQSVELATEYAKMLTKLDDVYPAILQSEELAEVQNQREQNLKNFFESCMENFMLTNPQCVKLWMAYIEFETLRNNLPMVNVLCYMALSTSLKSSSQVLIE
jgi:hypothetical protein